MHAFSILEVKGKRENMINFLGFVKIMSLSCICFTLPLTPGKPFL